MTAITGATGHLGRRGAEPSELVAVVRSPEKAADLAARGVVVHEADAMIDATETLAPSEAPAS